MGLCKSDFWLMFNYPKLHQLCMNSLLTDVWWSPQFMLQIPRRVTCLLQVCSLLSCLLSNMHKLARSYRRCEQASIFPLFCSLFIATQPSLWLAITSLQIIKIAKLRLQKYRTKTRVQNQDCTL